MDNNLKVNPAKYSEVVFYDKNQKVRAQLPPSISQSGIKRSTAMDDGGRTTLNNFKSHIYKVLEPKTDFKSYILDSECYVAKACAYLCRQCCFIDGFGELVKKKILGVTITESLSMLEHVRTVVNSCALTML